MYLKLAYHVCWYLGTYPMETIKHKHNELFCVILTCPKDIRSFFWTWILWFLDIFISEWIAIRTWVVSIKPSFPILLLHLSAFPFLPLSIVGDNYTECWFRLQPNKCIENLLWQCSPPLFSKNTHYAFSFFEGVLFFLWRGGGGAPKHCWSSPWERRKEKLLTLKLLILKIARVCHWCHGLCSSGITWLACLISYGL